jgi:Fe-S-cluster containining protein
MELPHAPFHSTRMKFPCTSCGACCRALPPGSSLDRGDGTCTHYDTATALCRIYETRPLLCRVDEIYAQRFERLVPRRVYYLLQAATCAQLDARNAGLPAAIGEALGEPAGRLVVEAGEARQAMVQILAGLSPHDEGMPDSIDTDRAVQAAEQLCRAAPEDAKADKAG